jgi:hypothetical protein
MRHEKPWIALGISRATWYRHGKPTTWRKVTMAEEAAMFGFPSLRSFQRVRRVLQSPLAPYVPLTEDVPGFSFGLADKLLSNPGRLKRFLEDVEKLKATLPPAEE